MNKNDQIWHYHTKTKTSVTVHKKSKCFGRENVKTKSDVGLKSSIHHTKTVLSDNQQIDAPYEPSKDPHHVHIKPITL